MAWFAAILRDGKSWVDVADILAIATGRKNWLCVSRKEDHDELAIEAA